MPYDPSKVMTQPAPRYKPDDDAPVYDDDNPPTWKDFVKAAESGAREPQGPQA